MVLYAGPLQVLYERGFLRYISYQDSEILRMIYFALRDENWDTCEHVITHEEKDISWETFQIKYRSVHRKNNEDLIRWNVTISGLPDSSIHFAIDGEVLKDLQKNRAGFCVLHPLKGVKGQPVEVTHPDGSTQSKQFPETVDPANPFKNIKKLKWSFENKWYELTFEGDIFETEDQRNWIDASFKTFCTPADLPIPVTLQAGTRISQRIHFRPLEKLQPITSHDSTIIPLEKTGKRTHVPKVGFSLPLNSKLEPAAIELLKQLNADHVLIEVRTSETDWITQFSQQCEVAYALNLPLKVVLMLPQNFTYALEQFITLIKQNRLRIIAVLLLTENKPVTEQKLIDEVARIRELLPDISWGAGTNGDFKDLNRNRFDAGKLDFISYSAHPQVHAVDDRTLIENIDGLRETGNSASLLYPAKAIEINPLTMHNRKGKKPEPRQKTELAALWAFGALRAVAEGNIMSVTIFEMSGENGIMAADGKPYPVYYAIQKIMRFRNHEVVELTNTEPLLVDAMLFTNESSTTLMLVNYTDDLQTVKYGRNEFQIPPMQLYEVNLSGT